MRGGRRSRRIGRQNTIGIPGKVAPADGEVEVDVVAQNPVSPYSWAVITVGGLARQCGSTHQSLFGGQPAGWKPTTCLRMVTSGGGNLMRCFHKKEALPNVANNPFGGSGAPTFVF